jgi:hypothetical protein
MPAGDGPLTVGLLSWNACLGQSPKPFWYVNLALVFFLRFHPGGIFWPVYDQAQ